MTWFNNPQTLESLKRQYKKLAFKYHPDCNNNDTTKEMQSINQEYDTLFQKLKNIHVNANGETYTSTKPNEETPEKFINIIETLIRFDNITIEIVGRFIWVFGDTKPLKETLKEMKFRFHSKKVAWFIAPEDYKKRNKKQYNMDEIRNMFGCQQVDTQPSTKIAAMA